MTILKLAQLNPHLFLGEACNKIHKWITVYRGLLSNKTGIHLKSRMINFNVINLVSNMTATQMWNILNMPRNSRTPKLGQFQVLFSTITNSKGLVSYPIRESVGGIFLYY